MSFTVFGPAAKSRFSSNTPCITPSTATLRSRSASTIAAPISLSRSLGSPGRLRARKVSANSPIGCDVFFKPSYFPANNDADSGTNQFQVMIHEIGHALGLKHPGDGGSADA